MESHPPQRFLTPEELRTLRPGVRDVIRDWPAVLVVLESLPIVGLAVLAIIIIAFGGLAFVILSFFLGLAALAVAIAVLFAYRAVNRPFEDDLREGLAQSIEGLVEKKRYYEEDGAGGGVGTLEITVGGKKFTTPWYEGFPAWDLHRIEEGSRVRVEYLPRSRVLVSMKVDASLSAKGEDWRSVWGL